MVRRKYFTSIIVILSLLLSSCQHSSSSNNYESLPLDQRRVLEVAKDQRYLLKNVNLISMTEENIRPISV